MVNKRLVVIFSIVALILCVPLVGTLTSDQMGWSAFDFAVAAGLLFGSGLAFELALRTSASSSYRAGAGFAVAAAFLLIWVNLAVGVLGSENNRANLIYVGVLAVQFVGSALARLRPAGMARALLATAIAQASVGALALAMGWGQPENGPLKILLINGFFAALFGTSAWFFHRSASLARPS